MEIIDQQKNLLRLLKLAKEDLEEWMDSIAGDMSFNADAIEETNSLVAEIESVLSNIGD
ncbi:MULTISPECIES: hypothetical protein [Paenibacillus]|uniref:Uncharacterized protein n=1 Tax=Paenibacillus polymyxa TaxID=1406 RepID=A0A378Y1L5_PAEPO|nr:MULTISPECIES: hypothetical protein [Paenibacillus]MBE7896099.1 hypothetical protein [Paenibacillus polymyxa]MCC3256632.1 hypothetical protein [Paenibacillus polymyxa]QPK54879.1 hypothetical protein G7035_20690 [Paenibacillus polymyxa]SUA70177.1 Uncharacterised protein [Paenibacillus polymyxa]